MLKRTIFPGDRDWYRFESVAGETHVVELFNVHKSLTKSKDLSGLVAQFSCLPGRTDLVEFYKTKNFQVLICEGGRQLYYYGIEKGGDRNSITLPAYYEEGTGYVAENGDYAYIVNSDTLSIYRGSTLLQQEQVDK